MDFQKLIYENNMLREQLHRSQQTYEMLVKQFQSLLQKNKDLKDAADQQEKIWHERLENEQSQFGETQKQLADLQKKYDALLDAFQKQQDQLAQFVRHAHAATYSAILPTCRSLLQSFQCS